MKPLTLIIESKISRNFVTYGCALTVELDEKDDIDSVLASVFQKCKSAVEAQFAHVQKEGNK